MGGHRKAKGIHKKATGLIDDLSSFISSLVAELLQYDHLLLSCPELTIMV